MSRAGIGVVPSNDNWISSPHDRGQDVLAALVSLNHRSEREPLQQTKDGGTIPATARVSNGGGLKSSRIIVCEWPPCCATTA